MKTGVRIVILNYNGVELLSQCLPSVVEARARAGEGAQLTLLDNCSTDRGPDYVAQSFPSVTVVRSSKNKILCSYNEYLPQIQEPIVILLNNDIRVEPDFIAPLVEKFHSDPLTFLVAPRCMSLDGTHVEAGPSKGRIRWGYFRCEAKYAGYEEDSLKPSETFSCGFGAFNREIFLKLGGYDERYLPGIMEDVDLCYRARKTGYRLYYEPRSVVYHIGQVSFKKAFGADRIQVLACRNTFLFMWKNFHGIVFWLSHFFFIPLRLLYSLLTGKGFMLRGFIEALRLPKES